MTEKEKHDMFWADQIAREAKTYNGKHVVGDAKTPSGRIHIGSLRGLVIHDIIHKAVVDSGQKSEYVHRFDDFDPMDGFPPDLPESYRKHMGEPLCNIPSPEKGFDSLAQYYALEFKGVFEKLGCSPRIVWASQSYRSGKMNSLVRTALENAEKIREINVRVSGAKKADGWLPINVVCDTCGKIGTPQAVEFTPDGETIPRLSDDWDKFSRIHFGREENRDPDVPRIFALSQLSGKAKEHFHPQFSFVAFLVQVPSADVAKAIEKYKGSPLTHEEKEELKARTEYAKVWLEKFADESAKISIAKNADWNGVSEKAKQALSEYAEFLGLSEEKQSEKVREICAARGISIQEFYKAAYKIFISREKGPKLIPFLNALDKGFVGKRLREKE